MNEDLVRDLRDDADWAEKSPDFTVPTILLYEMRKAADAIEELQQTVEQMKAIVIVEAQHTEMFDERDKKTLMEMVKSLPLQIIPHKDEKPRWIPVTERLPESVDDDVLVTDGEGCAVGYWRPDAQAWDSTDFGWLENRSEPPCGIHTVTHWMPLPPLPELPKEEA